MKKKLAMLLAGVMLTHWRVGKACAGRTDLLEAETGVPCGQYTRQRSMRDDFYRKSRN